MLDLVDEYLVDFLLKDDSVVEHCLRSCPDKFRRWNWRLLLRDRGAKASGLKEGIRASAQVEFCSQPNKRPLSQDCDHELRQEDLAKPHHQTAIGPIQV